MSLSQTLTWVDGGGSTSFNVWFDGIFIVNQAGNSYSKTGLLSSTTYTWRIDSLNVCGITPGDTWVFTTGIYTLAMEDFEEYSAPVALNGLNGGTGWNGAWISS